MALSRTYSIRLRKLPDENSLIAIPLSIFLIIDGGTLAHYTIATIFIRCTALAVDIALAFRYFRLSISITYFAENFTQEENF